MSRFDRVRDHLSHLEDEIRTRLVAVRREIAAIDARLEDYDQEQRAAISWSDPRQRPQVLLFCQRLEHQRALARRQLAACRAREATVRGELVTQHRRRRSVEALIEREARARRQRDEQRAAKDADDRALRQWLEAVR